MIVKYFVFLIFRDVIELRKLSFLHLKAKAKHKRWLSVSKFPVIKYSLRVFISYVGEAQMNTGD